MLYIQDANHHSLELVLFTSITDIVMVSFRLVRMPVIVW